MEQERVLLQRDKDSITKYLSKIGYKIRDEFQPLADMLKELNISPNKEIFINLIENRNSLDQTMKLRAKEETKLVPAVYSLVEEKFLKELEPVKKLATEIRENMLNNSDYQFTSDFFYKNIEIDENWNVDTVPEFRENVYEMFSDYADSDERKEVLEKAQELIDKLNEFTQLVRNYDTPLTEFEKAIYARSIAGYRPQLCAISHWDTKFHGIIEIQSDGNLEINKERVVRIKQ